MSELNKIKSILVYFISIVVALITASCNKNESVKINDTLPYSDQTNKGNWILNKAISDEFNDNTIDLTKWVNYFNEWNGMKPSWYTGNNSFEQDGYINFVLKKELLQEMDKGFDYTCGVIRTNTAIKYGYFEVKAKAMNSAACCAFFLSNWSETFWNEIDVFEIGAKAKGHEMLIHHGVHEFYNADNVIEPWTIIEKIHYAIGDAWETSWNPALNFHIYGLEWNQEYIIWHIDGEETFKIKNDRWHQPLIISIESHIDINWMGLPLDEDLSSLFQVDYFRVFSKK